MVAASRKGSRGNARDRSPAPEARTRSKSPASTKRAGSTAKRQKQPAHPEEVASVFIPVLTVLVISGVMIAAVSGVVPANISTLFGGAGKAAGNGVNFMGFSGREVDAFFSSLTMILVSEVG